MNYVDFFTQPNGFPLEADATLGFMQTDYQNGVNALAKMAGGNYTIVTGITETGSTVSDGWFLYNGELVYFQGGTKSTDVIIEETTTQKANQNGQLVDRYTVKVAKFGSGAGAFPYSNLKRVQTLEQVVSRLNALAGLESAVILKGLEVSNVNTGASTLDIAAGSVLIDGQFRDVSAYSGQYPVYLKPDGVFTLAVPGSGSYVTFDPYTSQRLADVYRRATTPTGQVIMTTVKNDRFDGTGLGKWEMKGFALMNGSNGTYDMRSRFPIAFDDRNSDPGGNDWSPLHNIMNQQGSSNKHTLTIAEMPEHNHTGGPTGVSVDPGEDGLIRRSEVGDEKTVSDFDTGGSGIEPDAQTSPVNIPMQGGGQPHENRPAFQVLAFVQRI